jgi:hypothetical protein
MEAYSIALYAQDTIVVFNKAYSPHMTDSIEALWSKEMRRYTRILEQTFGLLFDTSWTPRVSFVKKVTYEVYYDKISQSYLVTHLYLPLLPRDSGTAFVADLLGHELGHALADQRSRHTRGVPWADTSVWNHGPKRARFVQALIAEGTAEYFGRLLSRDTTGNIRMIPKRISKREKEPKSWKYSGGYTLVKPILDSFGIRGLDYIIENTAFPGRSFNFRKSAKRYQTRAFALLSKQTVR